MITFLALIIFHYFTLWLPTLIFWFVLIPGTVMFCTLAHMPGQRPWKIHIARTSACIRSRSHTHTPRMTSSLSLVCGCVGVWVHTLERTLARTHACMHGACVRACVHTRTHARTHFVARFTGLYALQKTYLCTYAADNTEYGIQLYLHVTQGRAWVYCTWCCNMVLQLVAAKRRRAVLNYRSI
jgi:hypothetical protein